jgi:tRNA threonylcarbamoyladenosine modification (KEOPS) complex  Pcc1 subunit
MAAKKQDFRIRQGETFQRVVRWETTPYIYKAITAITQAAPAAITATAHGLKTGWRAAVVSAQGMTEINAVHAPPRDSDFRQVTVSDANTVLINGINSSEFSAYVSGGYLQFFTPQDLTGYTARMMIKDRVGGTVLLSLTSGAPDNRIALDVTNNTITITISAADTAALTWTRGVYDLELVSASSVVTTLFTGNVFVTKEVTAP